MRVSLADVGAEQGVKLLAFRLILISRLLGAWVTLLKYRLALSHDSRSFSDDAPPLLRHQLLF